MDSFFSINSVGKFYLHLCNNFVKETVVSAKVRKLFRVHIFDFTLVILEVQLDWIDGKPTALLAAQLW